MSDWDMLIVDLFSTSPDYGDNVTIFAVLPQLKILPSKQKPRFLEILGSDGCLYPYLLKGREDLRQDQRATQVIRFLDQLVLHSKFKRAEPFRFLSPFASLKTALVGKLETHPSSKPTTIISAYIHYLSQTRRDMRIMFGLFRSSLRVFIVPL